jgi:hypothetical protein
LRGAFCCSAVEALEIRPHALESISLLVQLPHQPAALRGWIAEDREKPEALTSYAARLGDQPIDFKLLAVDHFFAAPNLLGARRICIAAIEASQLGFESLANRVRGLGLRNGERY